jgi:tetratricopeptide (TPR) repeat protein/tRNA A-37 threonylcarbamoyl transferase component Bud32/TolB-like protein
MTVALERLTTALADRYRIERELGQGGMATVYLAQDLKHRRQVAIKVLRPELAAVLGPERFLREIDIAAGLQHPHIMPVYDSGDADGLLYYVMPFVEGESLAARIAREGALPAPLANRILREVADALSYAHSRGLVHRDIKPDNILLSGQHALVADFGIARAMHDAAGNERLTATGMALGTPAYMAPEQATGEAVDHRADLYALGVVGYEMLAGEPPFRGRTAQMVVAAHLSESPRPIQLHRPALPPALAATIMRCLEKHPADRMQSAAEVTQQLEIAATPAGGFAPIAPVTPPSPSTRRVAVLFAVGALVVLGAAYGLMIGLGLPDWVFPAAVALVLIGLPVVLTTSRVERSRVPEARPHPVFTWRRAIGGGALAFGVLAVVVAGYMAMRILGIGPAGTLVASGRLDAHPRILLADFTDRTGDSTLAAAVTEAIRVDLGQSKAVELVQRTAVQDALERMQRSRPAVLSEDLAREIATREGIRAVVGGEINVLGGGYVISARIVDPESGEVLVPLRETARDSTGIIPAVDRLSHKVRERIGESLRTIRETPALNQVTTASLPALRKYTQGSRAIDAGDVDRGIELFKEAIFLDTAFAAAYRGLSIALNNLDVERALSADAQERAFRFRDRLVERERLWTEGSYYMTTGQPERARVAYEALLEVEPDSARVLNNLGVVNLQARRPAEALGWYERALAFRPDAPPANFNVVATSLELGRVDRAHAVRARFDSLRPGHPIGSALRWMIGWATAEYDSVQATVDLLAARGGSTTEALATNGRLWLAGIRGQPSRFEAILAQSERRAAEGRQVPEHLRAVAWAATYEAVVQGQPERAIARIESAMSRFPLASLQPFDRPYAELAQFYARANRPAQARQLLAQFGREVPRQLQDRLAPDLGLARAYATLAEGPAQSAIREFQAADVGQCTTCVLPGLAQAWQLAGNQDSVAAVLARYLTQPDDDRAEVDPLERAGALARLGELYELRGDTVQAVQFNARFLELWRDADPEFRPVLDRVRERQRRLTAERPAAR